MKTQIYATPAVKGLTSRVCWVSRYDFELNVCIKIVAHNNVGLFLANIVYIPKLLTLTYSIESAQGIVRLDYHVMMYI